jgi:hypothetical protein
MEMNLCTRKPNCRPVLRELSAIVTPIQNMAKDNYKLTAVIESGQQQH